MAKITVERDGFLIAPWSANEVTRAKVAAREVGEIPRPSQDGKLWLPYACGAALRAAFPPAAHRWTEDANRAATEGPASTLGIKDLVREAMDHPVSFVSDYPLLSALDPHQTQALAAMVVEGIGGLAIFDEQGTGKTVSALSAFHLLKLRRVVDKMLVVAPKSTLGGWAAMAGRWLDPETETAVVSGTAKQRSATIMSIQHVLIVSYDTAVSDGWLLRAWAQGHGARTMLVVDESFYVKNPQARRSRALSDLRSVCTRAYVLCGTPAPNSEVDVVHQVQLVDGGATFGSLVVPSGAAARDPGLSGAIRSLFRARAPYIRRLKSETLALPQRTYERTLLPMAPRQAAHYDEAARALEVEIRTIDDRTFTRNLSKYMARRSFLLQLCSHPGAVIPHYDEDPAKCVVLDGLLRDLVEGRGEKVVLWSFYRFSLRALRDRFARYGAVLLDGSVTDTAARTEMVSRFQTDPGVRLFVGNPAAAGMGLTLTAARHVVYESLSNQAVHYLQSLDRVHRRGQTREVSYHVLLCSGTLEVAEYQRLLDKERAARELLGDPDERPASRERFIAELRGETS